MTSFDSYKCLNGPCDFCPLQTLDGDDWLKSHAAGAVASVLQDPLFGAGGHLESSTCMAVGDQAQQVTQRHGYPELRPVVAAALALKAVGVCEQS